MCPTYYLLFSLGDQLGHAFLPMSCGLRECADSAVLSKACGAMRQVLANIENAQRQNRLYDALKQGNTALAALQQARFPYPSTCKEWGMNLMSVATVRIGPCAWLADSEQGWCQDLSNCGLLWRRRR